MDFPNITNAPLVRLGDYIEIREERNKDGHPYHFCGINRDKHFMPTVADTNGLDNTKYKVVRKGVFVFSGMQTGRDICIRLALYEEDVPCLISPAYTTFVVKDNDVLNEKYLFLYFYRYEMDRYGAFLSDGSIRSNLDWDRFCDIEIPLPSIEVQRELVAIYDGLQKIISDNEALLKPLEEACRAFIVDCKSKYPKVKLGDFIEERNERNSDNALDESYARGVNTSKEIQYCKRMGEKLSTYKKVHCNDFVYNANIKLTRTTEKFAIALYKEKQDIIVTNFYIVFYVSKGNLLLSDYLFMHLSTDEFAKKVRFISCSNIRDRYDFDDLSSFEIPLPPIEVQRSIAEVARCAEMAKRIIAETRELLKGLCPALIQKARHTA